MALIYNNTEIPSTGQVIYNNTDCSKVYYNNTLVWEKWTKPSSVTLTNLCGSSAAFSGYASFSDIGYNSGTIGNLIAYTNSSHRYYVRGESFGWAYSNGAGARAEATAKVGGTEVAWGNFVNRSPSNVGYSGQGHAIISGLSSIGIDVYYERNNCTQGSLGANCYMLVDITPLENYTGYLNADQFWAKCGYQIRWNSFSVAI